ncbi:hypothetical protein LINPERHAP1_LOCUS30993 [Linum perenne]
MDIIPSNHPFYIGANDNPGALLLSTVLTGPRDFSWARSMKRALMMKNKLATGNPTYAAWERANVLVLGWLNKAMAAEIARTVLWLDSVRGVWVDLEERFNRSNSVRIKSVIFVKAPFLFRAITPDSRCSRTNTRCYVLFCCVSAIQGAVVMLQLGLENIFNRIRSSDSCMD